MKQEIKIRDENDQMN